MKVYAKEKKLEVRRRSKVGGIIVCGHAPAEILKFGGSEMPFPVLSTGHFNKYERKCKWLEYILLISSVGNHKQTKGEIACMTAVSLRLSCKTSLVMRSEKRRMYSLAKGDTLTLKTGKRHEYNAKNLSVTPV